MQEAIKTTQAPTSPFYSQAILCSGFVFVSGQVPIDPKTGKLIPGGITEQTQQVLANIEAILRANHLDFSHLVKVEIYLKEIQDLQVVNALYLKTFSHSPKPARQAMQVASLPFDSLIEISCIARI